jgi:two-component system, OmpR family, phosphate regulon sensor histidine kinase PhoR
MYLLVVLVSLSFLAWYDYRSTENLYIEQLTNDLKLRAVLACRLVSQADGSLKTNDEIDKLCKEFGKSIATRITVILPDGTVIGDSESNPSKMDNHAERPEIKKAVGGEIGNSRRYSSTLKQTMMYLGYPVTQNGRVIGILRVSLPMAGIGAQLSHVEKQTAFAAIIVVLLSALVSLAISRRITTPLNEMRLGTARFARGDLEHRLPVPEFEEMAVLAESMNSMARQLHERLETTAAQRNEKEAMLSSMSEGIIAIDAKERIMEINPAAEHLLGLDHGTSLGKTIQETVQSVGLLDAALQTLESGSVIEKEMILHKGTEDMFLQVHGTPLRDTEKKRIGALIVLSDVTRLRRLENIRKEFVANVSHELKTPITSIKGFVENLTDGSTKNQQEQARMLGIINRQTDRLSSLVDDILILSRIEHDAEQDKVELTFGSICPVLRNAADGCAKRAEKKRIDLRVECDGDIQAHINAGMLEQALTNLIDNAINYSNEGSAVEITGRKGDKDVVIAVKDSGCGMEKQHLDRIFERFYRVDKARSRQSGGTGLGLAIVKHIALAHNGKVEVESEPGRGSTFSLRLPYGG